MADNLAMRLDCDVWVPDYFQGPPINTYTHLRQAVETHMGVCHWIKSKLRRISLFMQNRPAAIDTRLLRFIKALQEEKDYLKIGVVGYCSGGPTAIRLASTDWIQSVVVYHPRKLKLPDVQAIKVPSAWICAKEDKFFNESLRHKVEETLRRGQGHKDLQHEFTDSEGE
ncbi:hypothetical protein C0991_006805 [Blastosporella zonata]|nr:hypothetical protein C0991_006805 [Blastosporella zonata]